MKSHKLSFDKCEYAGIQIFWKDNVVKYDIYNTGFAFIYVSTKPYPSEYEGRIDKLRCTDEFIKFPRSERICECLAARLPDPQNRMFIEFTKISQRRKRRLEREKEKKKRK